MGGWPPKMERHIKILQPQLHATLVNRTFNAIIDHVSEEGLTRRSGRKRPCEIVKAQRMRVTDHVQRQMEDRTAFVAMIIIYSSLFTTNGSTTSKKENKESNSLTKSCTENNDNDEKETRSYHTLFWIPKRARDQKRDNTIQYNTIQKIVTRHM